MKSNSVCASRRLQRVQISTPLLIPSFSSTESENIRQIHEDLSEYISRASLVSAYDIKNKFIDKKALSCSEVVFIDSGNYEKEYLAKVRSAEIDWSYNDYLEVINSLDSLNKFVIVNYDEVKSLSVQISNANKLFSSHSDYANCFLCKPKFNGKN